LFHVKQETPPALRFLEAALADLEQKDLLRTRPPPTAPGTLSFCSNDYLGLAAEPPPVAPGGAGASRLVSGERAEHVEAERAAAELVGLPEALMFSSGYAANVGLVSALAGPGDLIVSDTLNHASLIDGARLSRARVAVVPHLDASAVERALAEGGPGRSFVVTESYFSMDADAPDLAVLRRICDAAGAALVVDEAHALGVLGPEGRGLCAAAGVRPDAMTGTFGKAFGAGGAFVAGSPALVQWLWNRARSFVFSTGLSPAVAAAAAAGVARARQEPARRERVLEMASGLRSLLAARGMRVEGFGPIIPWIVGDPALAMRIAAELRATGLDVRAICPPTVPPGTARLRLTVTGLHRAADLDRFAAALDGLRARGIL
jgi:8-amino-7-oxononanoate synthase